MENSPKPDLFSPAEMASIASENGTKKTKLPVIPMFLLAIQAGAFIAFGALLCIVVGTNTLGTWPYGIARILMGFVFCLGLILIVVGGGELFTGNSLLIIPLMQKKFSLGRLLRNWFWVYLGNFAGSCLIALLFVLARTYASAQGDVGRMMLNTAITKVNLDFGTAIVSGMLCNMLVCLAVWLTYSGRSTIDKIVAILFPITAFVAAGFEHSVANMFFIPSALFLKSINPAFVATLGIDVSSLTWGNFLLHNLLPVSLGNILGGAGWIGLMVWRIFLRDNAK